MANNEAVRYGLLSAALVLLTWELASGSGIVDPFSASSPSAIIEDLGPAITTGGLLYDTGVTAAEWFAGFGLATLLGVPLGLMAGRAQRLGALIEHWSILLLVIPMVALVPIFVVWLGIGPGFKVLVGFLTALPVIVLNTLEGVKSVDREFLSVGRAFGAGTSRTTLQIVMPSAMASILAGIRLGAGQALVGVVFAEMTASTAGLGHAIRTAGSTFNATRLLLATVTLGIMAVAVGAALQALERRAERWREA